MTITEMHEAILQEVDKEGERSVDSIYSGEIDNHINSAIREYINQNRQYLREYSGDAQNIEAMENLRTLETESITTNVNTPSDIPNGFSLDLSSEFTDYDYYISGRAECNGYWKTLKLVNRHYLNQQSNTKYKDPVFKDLPVIIDNDELFGIYGKYDNQPVKIAVNYLQTPTKVSLENNQGTDLPESTHRTIVDLAIQNIVRSLVNQTGGSKNQSETKE